MLKLAVVVCVVLWSSLAEAVRWDFDGETTQGWAAKKSISSGGRHSFHLLSGVVANGVWMIETFRSDDHNPSVEVILLEVQAGDLTGDGTDEIVLAGLT